MLPSTHTHPYSSSMVTKQWQRPSIYKGLRHNQHLPRRTNIRANQFPNTAFTPSHTPTKDGLQRTDGVGKQPQSYGSNVHANKTSTRPPWQLDIVSFFLHTSNLVTSISFMVDCCERTCIYVCNDVICLKKKIAFQN